jgi:undecaprenyl-diphosphatase
MHETVIIIAKYFIVLAVLIAFAVWLRVSTPQKKRFIVLAVLGGIFSLALAKLGSKLYSDPRPFVAGHFTPYFSHAPDNGFPSDHSVAAGLIAALLLMRRHLVGVLFAVGAALIAWARVAAHVHHLQDVLTGLALGAAAAVIASVAVGWLLARLGHRIPWFQQQPLAQQR